MLRVRSATVATMLIGCCFGLTLKLFARPVEKAIKSHLQRIGATVKSVTTTNTYRVSYACDSVVDCLDDVLPVGTAFKILLNFQYAGVVVTLPEFYASLLIYDSQRQVILDDALLAWQESVRARAVSRGWGKFQATFDELFLADELPEGSQLIMLAEHHGVFTYHSRPIASTASELGLSAPVTADVLESFPPRIKWTLNLKTPIAGNIHVRWYVEDLTSGDIIDADDFITPPDSAPQSTLAILSSRDDKWSSNACRRLNVYINRNPIGEEREIYRAPTVVASEFGRDC